ncbi:hypothetical protein CSUI_002785 [Cystoisospora suis]|uniref:Uncharacterized protein n=1 Tax=Cystoisospora suis TaxID=483139 RepID=A0A2C6L7W9_9APIC|nr:hypothetical protein CSUI_002785 [Cystoisospora suis]
MLSFKVSPSIASNHPGSSFRNDRLSYHDLFLQGARSDPYRRLLVLRVEPLRRSLFDRFALQPGPVVPRTLPVPHRRWYVAPLLLLPSSLILFQRPPILPFPYLTLLVLSRSLLSFLSAPFDLFEAAEGGSRFFRHHLRLHHPYSLDQVRCFCLVFSHHQPVSSSPGSLHIFLPLYLSLP